MDLTVDALEELCSVLSDDVCAEYFRKSTKSLVKTAGSSLSIAGTVLDKLGEEAKQAMDTADVIIAKGQANAETLLDSGYNIYYAFLVKCVRFEARYGKPKFTPMFVKERQ